MANNAWAIAHPSLALIKYWGKQDSTKNLPATPSLAITLSGLNSTVNVQAGSKDQVILEEQEQDISRFTPFFDNLRQFYRTDVHFIVHSSNNFPTAAGLASSSSAFAALAAACVRLMGKAANPQTLSGIARTGSGSASRAVYGGFTHFPAGSDTAHMIHAADHWPKLRIILCLVEKGPKAISSRDAMELTRRTSPYYPAWVNDGPALLEQALPAVQNKDLAKLGPLIRLSYQRMFGTMLGAAPPIIYWKPDSLALIHWAQQQREQGFCVWETMDAGPQVKFFCLEDEIEILLATLQKEFPHIHTLTSRPGPGVNSGPGTTLL